MPMNNKQWGADGNLWKSNTTTAKTTSWPDSSIKQTAPISISISTAATSDLSNISYDPYFSTHVFKKVNIDAPKPTDNIWIGTSHVLLPTFWCSKCDSWSSHHDKLHGKRIRWQTMKNAQLAKQDDYQKQTQQNHYGHPCQQNIVYGRNNNNKPSTNTCDRENYQDTNAPEMIVVDHPREIAPTPRRAAQGITTETAHHSMTTKINT
jgi:hypothetical protein